MKTVIILGSSRDHSNTLSALRSKYSLSEAELVELHQLNIGHWVYGEDKPKDDFLSVAKKMTTASHIVFATPVYWYAMSGTMKVFFDRLSELITIHKPIGRALAGRTTELFCTGSEDYLPDGFEVPFQRTSNYFDMKYQGSTYICVKS